MFARSTRLELSKGTSSAILQYYIETYSFGTNSRLQMGGAFGLLFFSRPLCARVTFTRRIGVCTSTADRLFWTETGHAQIWRGNETQFPNRYRMLLYTDCGFYREEFPLQKDRNLKSELPDCSRSLQKRDTKNTRIVIKRKETSEAMSTESLTIKQPIRRLEIQINNFNVAIPHHVNLLKRHKNNIKKVSCLTYLAFLGLLMNDVKSLHLYSIRISTIGNRYGENMLTSRGSSNN